jgi:hypothetical protein
MCDLLGVAVLFEFKSKEYAQACEDSMVDVIVGSPLQHFSAAGSRRRCVESWRNTGFTLYELLSAFFLAPANSPAEGVLVHQPERHRDGLA